jgi:hypothetical protein
MLNFMFRVFVPVVIASLIALGVAQHREAKAQQGPIYCDHQATSAAGFTTIVQIVPAPATGSARILVCGYTVSAATASVVTFQSGTGTNCGTGTAAVGPTIQLGVTSTYGENPGTYQGFSVPASNALCATATSAANISVYWTFR